MTNIDSLVLSQNANFDVTVANAMVSTADFNKDGTGGDLSISSDTAMSNNVIIDASGLTGVNRIVVDGTNLGGNDTITGGAGNDSLTGGAGNDMLNGGLGDDTYVFGLTDGTDTITETGGTADTIVIQANGAVLSGLNFTDSTNTDNSGNAGIAVNGAALSITVNNQFAGGGNAVEFLTFSGGASYLGFALGSAAYRLSTDDVSPQTATAGENTILIGDGGGTTLTGNTGKDLLFGNGGDDTLTGGGGGDLLVGGAGNDKFVFTATTDSTPAAFDTIADFTPNTNSNHSSPNGDLIDLSAIDASTAGGVQHFTSVTNTSSPGAAQNNNVWWFVSGGETIIRADTNGSFATAELEIHLAGIHTLTANSFNL